MLPNVLSVLVLVLSLQFSIEASVEIGRYLPEKVLAIAKAFPSLSILRETAS